MKIDLRSNKIQELKNKLSKTDYKALKFVEGEITEEDFEPVKIERKTLRLEINRIEVLTEEEAILEGLIIFVDNLPKIEKPTKNIVLSKIPEIKIEDIEE